jgi:hypothetical protein
MTSGPVNAWRSATAAMTRAGWLATAAVVLALLAVSGGIYALTRALLVRSADVTASVQQQTERVTKFKESFDRQLAQLAGRTMFHTPPKTGEEEPAPAGPPPKPTRYGGPEIIALIGDAVWFKDGQVLRVGEQGDDELEVVEPRGPWSAVLRWRGVEFDVPLFERTTSEFLSSSQSEKD